MNTLLKKQRMGWSRHPAVIDRVGYVHASLVNLTFDVVSSSTMFIHPPSVASQSLNDTESNVRVFDAGMLI